MVAISPPIFRVMGSVKIRRTSTFRMPRDIEFNLVGARHGQKVSDPLRQERRDLACALNGLCDLEQAPPPLPRNVGSWPHGDDQQSLAVDSSGARSRHIRIQAEGRPDHCVGHRFSFASVQPLCAVSSP